MLQDKVCIVTGAASGIGLATTEAFAKDGAKVVMADINKEKLISEAERIGYDYLIIDLSIGVESSLVCHLKGVISRLHLSVILA